MAKYIRKDGFNGNTSLKKAGVKAEWTQEQFAEYVKCKSDPLYFVEKYMKIISVDKGLIPFKMYPYQKKVLTAFFNRSRVVVLQSRQSGKSTTYCAFILHYILFNDYKTVALLANKGDTAREILYKVQLAYENLPLWLQQGAVEWNKGSAVLENGSEVFATSTSSESIRGRAVNVVIIDECIGGDSMITVRDNETGEIKEVSMLDLYTELYEDQLECSSE